MKLKEIDRTANVAWSPSQSSAIYLAAGTAAQQLDSSFSSNAALELYSFDIGLSGLDMPLSASVPCDSRYFFFGLEVSMTPFEKKYELQDCCYCLVGFTRLFGEVMGWEAAVEMVNILAE